MTAITDQQRETWMEFYKRIGTTEHMSAGQVRRVFQEWLEASESWVSVSCWGLFLCS
jgi:hypothetical protein